MSDAKKQQRAAFKEWLARNEYTVADVAKAADVPATTLYSYYDGKSQSLNPAAQAKIALAYSTPAHEIFSPQLVPLIGFVGADSEGTVTLATGDQRTDFVLKPPGGTTDSVALEVRGYSMRGIADDGSLVFYENQQTPPTEDMFGDVVILETEDNLLLVKRLLRGSEPGLYDLESIVGPTLTNKRVRWAAWITAIVPKRHAAKILRRSVA